MITHHLLIIACVATITCCASATDAQENKDGTGKIVPSSRPQSGTGNYNNTNAPMLQGATNGTLFPDDRILANQKMILANQRKILANQKSIMDNQRKLDVILANQKKLDQILANQQTIMSNQSKGDSK